MKQEGKKVLTLYDRTVDVSGNSRNLVNNYYKEGHHEKIGDICDKFEINVTSKSTVRTHVYG